MPKKTTARRGASLRKPASADGLFLAGQRARTGKCDRARGRAFFRDRRSAIDLLPDDLLGRGSSFTLHDPPADASLFEIVEDVERRIITDMLEKCNWNQTEAAERFQSAALHAESENPPAEYRDQEEERG